MTDDWSLLMRLFLSPADQLEVSPRFINLRLAKFFTGDSFLKTQVQLKRCPLVSRPLWPEEKENGRYLPLIRSHGNPALDGSLVQRVLPDQDPCRPRNKQSTLEIDRVQGGCDFYSCEFVTRVSHRNFQSAPVGWRHLSVLSKLIQFFITETLESISPCRSFVKNNIETNRTQPCIWNSLPMLCACWRR